MRIDVMQGYPDIDFCILYIVDRLRGRQTCFFMNYPVLLTKCILKISTFCAGKMINRIENWRSDVDWMHSADRGQWYAAAHFSFSLLVRYCLEMKYLRSGPGNLSRAALGRVHWYVDKTSTDGRHSCNVTSNRSHRQLWPHEDIVCNFLYGFNTCFQLYPERQPGLQRCEFSLLLSTISMYAYFCVWLPHTSTEL